MPREPWMGPRPHEDAGHEWPDPPSGATCPECGVRLTRENVFHGFEGDADDIPIYRLQCVGCALENKRGK